MARPLAHLRRSFAAVLIGFGTIFGAKAQREQHWSIPPTMVIEDHAQDLDGRDDDRLPECA